VVYNCTNLNLILSINATTAKLDTWYNLVQYQPDCQSQFIVKMSTQPGDCYQVVQTAAIISVFLNSCDNMNIPEDHSLILYLSIGCTFGAILIVLLIGIISYQIRSTFLRRQRENLNIKLKRNSKY